MTKGKVEGVSPSKSGKSFRIKIDGEWYGAGKDSGLDKMEGKTVEFSFEDGDFGPWIQEWKEAAGAPSAQGKQSSGPWWMPFVSNTVAHAIQAGEIKDPKAISAWAKAAKDAAEALEAL